MIYNIQPKIMTATQMRVDIIPPYTSDTFNTYWEIITANGKVIDRGNMSVPIQYMPLFVNVIKNINENGDVIGDEIRTYLNAILSDPSIDLFLAELPINNNSGDNSGDNTGGTQSGDNSGDNTGGTQSGDNSGDNTGGTQSGDNSGDNTGGTQSGDNP